MYIERAKETLRGTQTLIELGQYTPTKSNPADILELMNKAVRFNLGDLKDVFTNGLLKNFVGVEAERIANAFPQQPPYDIIWLDYNLRVKGSYKSYISGVLCTKREFFNYTGPHSDIDRYSYALCFFNAHPDYPLNMGMLGVLVFFDPDDPTVWIEPEIQIPTRHQKIVNDMTGAGVGALRAFLALINMPHIEAEKLSIPKRVNNRRIKKNKLPLPDYHVLNIVAPDVCNKKGEVLSKGSTQRLHLVRGHFAEYTPANPMFGKYVGVFYRQAHARGDKKKGWINKRYRVRTK